MPRNVRNFWIELEVDGKKTKVATGPRSKDGGFQLTVKMRDHGRLMTALYVSAKAAGNGLFLNAVTRNSQAVGVETDR